MSEREEDKGAPVGGAGRPRKKRRALAPPPVPRVDVPVEATEDDVLATDPMAAHFKSDAPDAGGAADKIAMIARAVARRGQSPEEPLEKPPEQETQSHRILARIHAVRAYAPRLAALLGALGEGDGELAVNFAFGSDVEGPLEEVERILVGATREWEAVLALVRAEAEAARGQANDYLEKKATEEARVWRKTGEVLGRIGNAIERGDHRFARRR